MGMSYKSVMIPKIIHYCWFGNKPLGENEIKCIESWKKYLPDYEIKLWNEENYDINKVTYIKQAYQEKKYAFVSDYARFDILYNYGGVYFDTDVEVIKSMDEIIEKGAFMGCETGGKNIAVNPGLGIATERHNLFYKEVLEYYSSMEFIKEDGTYNTVTIVEYVTALLKKYGLKNIKKLQSIAGICIYPEEYFCPMNMWTKKLKITDNTYSIHHYSASWTTEEQKLKNAEVEKLSRYFGVFIAKIITLYHFEIKKNGFWSVFGYTYSKIKKYCLCKKYGKE